MKSILKKITILGLIIFTLSCSKDDEAKQVFEIENPLMQYLSSAGFTNEYSPPAGFGFYEVGFAFKPLVNGKIISINIKLPQIRNDVKVTIWDLQTQSVIFEDNFDVTLEATNVVFDINPLILMNNKEYIISMNTDSYYINSANLFNPVDSPHPIIVGNISILNSRSISGSAQVFPSTISTSSYTGNCSFNFQPTE